MYHTSQWITCIQVVKTCKQHAWARVCVRLCFQRLWFCLSAAAALITHGGHDQYLPSRFCFTTSPLSLRAHAHRTHTFTRRHRSECKKKTKRLSQTCVARGPERRAAINIYPVRNAPFYPGQARGSEDELQRLKQGRAHRKDKLAILPVKSATVITRGERESAH